jgi:aspartate 1-decarboxylase
MRLVQLLKSKIHHARLTYCNKDYVGSIEICHELMERSGILPGELVQVWAVDHASRISTYAFPGPMRTIGVNGGAAHYFQPGDRLIITAFEWTDEDTVDPKIILVDENNEFVNYLEPFRPDPLPRGGSMP